MFQLPVAGPNGSNGILAQNLVAEDLNRDLENARAVTVLPTATVVVRCLVIVDLKDFNLAPATRNPVQVSNICIGVITHGFSFRLLSIHPENTLLLHTCYEVLTEGYRTLTPIFHHSTIYVYCMLPFQNAKIKPKGNFAIKIRKTVMTTKFKTSVP